MVHEKSSLPFLLFNFLYGFVRHMWFFHQKPDSSLWRFGFWWSHELSDSNHQGLYRFIMILEHHDFGVFSPTQPACELTLYPLTTFPGV